MESASKHLASRIAPVLHDLNVASHTDNVQIVLSDPRVRGKAVYRGSTGPAPRLLHAQPPICCQCHHEHHLWPSHPSVYFPRGIFRLTLGDCEEIRQIYGVLTRFATFRRPGAYLIDVWPELESWPMYDVISGWKKTADDIHKQDTAVFTHFWNKMKTEIDQGTAPHSWGKLFLQSDYKKHGVDDLAAIYAA